MSPATFVRIVVNMAHTTTCVVLSRIIRPALFSSKVSSLDPWNIQARCYAARKGTREKARKKKLEQKIKKVEKAPEKKADKQTTGLFAQQTKEYSTLDPGTENVYIMRTFRSIKYPFKEAFQNHKEAHDPSIYDAMTAPLNIIVELNMVAEKSTRFISPFKKMIGFPYPFSKGLRNHILVLCKDPEQIEQAYEDGADLAGGADLVEKLEKGELKSSSFETVVAHPSMITELIPLKGLLKGKFPSPAGGTLGLDLGAMIRRFKFGVEMQCKKPDDNPALGMLDIPIGLVNMGVEKVEANFISTINEINAYRPAREGSFITWVTLYSTVSKEYFKIDFEPHLVAFEPKARVKRRKQHKIKISASELETPTTVQEPAKASA